MRRPSLRSQLNQIRLWVRQGRTDAWIAHKLDISVEQLRTFKRDQGLDEPGAAAPAPPEPLELNDVQEAETEEGAHEAIELELPEADRMDEPSIDVEREVEREVEEEAVPPADRGDEAQRERDSDGGRETEREAEPARRRRRGRRGGRRRAGKAAGSFEATFDHGDEGYGLWLDPAVAKNDVYSEHWAGHRAVSVTVEPDAITIRRVETDSADADDRDGDDD